MEQENGEHDVMEESGSQPNVPERKKETLWSQDKRLLALTSFSVKERESSEGQVTRPGFIPASNGPSSR